MAMLTYPKGTKFLRRPFEISSKNQFLLTTARSEVVPFLRGVRRMERGHEATSPLGGRSPPPLGREATLAVGSPEFASFSPKSWSKSRPIWMKLGMIDV